MNTLHLFNESPFVNTSFINTLALLQPDDGILLMGDAVYALQANTKPSHTLQHISATIYALDEDITVRALQVGPCHFKKINYPEFVELCIQYTKVISWL